MTPSTSSPTPAFPWALFGAATVLAVASHSLTVGFSAPTLSPDGGRRSLLSLTMLIGVTLCADTLYRQRFQERPFWLLLPGAMVGGHWVALDADYLVAHVRHPARCFIATLAADTKPYVCDFHWDP